MHRILVKDAFGEAWSKVKKHFWFAVLWTAGVFIISAISSADPDPKIYTAADSLLFIISLVVSTYITHGTIKLALKLLEDERGDFNDFKMSWQMFWNLLFASFLYAAIVFGGLILLIVPGVIWAAKYSQIFYLVVDKRMDPVQALKESGRMTEGEKGKIVLIMLSSIGVVILGVLALFVGIFVAFPVVALVSAIVYKKLSIPVPAKAPNQSIETVSGPDSPVTQGS